MAFVVVEKCLFFCIGDPAFADNTSDLCDWYGFVCGLLREQVIFPCYEYFGK